MKIGITILLFATAISANAANHYIRAAADNTTGNDWTHAWTDLPTTFVRGDTYYVAGGSYGAHSFSTANSGTTVITIQKATVADHGTATGWNDSYETEALFSANGTWDFTTDYWTVDGKTGTGEGSYGLRILTTGETSYTASTALYPEGKHLTFKSVCIQAHQLYSIAYCVYNEFIDCSFLTFTNCLFLYGNAWIAINGSTTTDLLIDHCWFKDGGSTTAGAHWAGFTWQYNDGSAVNWVVRYSVFHNARGNANSNYIEPAGSGTWGGVSIYGCVFYEDVGVEGCSQSLLGDAGTGSYRNLKFYNNTMYNLHSPFAGNAGLILNENGGTGFVSNCLWQVMQDNGGGLSGVVGGNNIINSPTIAFVNAAAGNFHLVTNTVAGANLGSGFNTDMDGVTRSTWSVGAFEFVSSGAGITNFYASPTGNSGNTGLSSGSPWNLMYAVQHFGNSNTLTLAAGVYSEGAYVVTNHWGLIISSNKWAARIAGINGIGLQIQDGYHGVTVDGLEICSNTSDGLKFCGTNITIQNCHVWTNMGQGIAAHELTNFPVLNALVQGNLCEWNGQQGGLGPDHYHNAYFGMRSGTVRNNVFRFGTGYGLQIYPEDGMTNTGNLIYNNLCVSNDVGGSYGGGIVVYSNAYSNVLGSNYIFGNTIVQPVSTEGCIKAQYGSLFATNNVLSGSQRIQNGGSATITDDYNVSDSTISPSGTHNVQNATLAFVNTNRFLYWLASGSAARSAALSTIFGPVDFFGTAQASVTDAGAFQYSAALSGDQRNLAATGSDFWGTPSSANVAKSYGSASLGRGTY